MKTLITLLFFLQGITLFCQDTITDYYDEITIGSEYGLFNNRAKFMKDIKIYVYGEKNDTLIDELNKIVKELNELIESVNIEIVKDSSVANLEIYFGSYQYLSTVRPEKFIKKRIGSSFGYSFRYDHNDKILSAFSFIRTDLNSWGMELYKSTLREELTQSLGFGNDSYKYPDSVFYIYNRNTVSYSELDKLIIKKHYKL